MPQTPLQKKKSTGLWFLIGAILLAIFGVSSLLSANACWGSGECLGGRLFDATEIVAAILLFRTGWKDYKSK